MKSKIRNHRFWVWVVSLLLVGCKTIHHTTTENLQEIGKSAEEVKLKTLVVDSVRQIDSVRVEYKRGKTDTLLIERWRNKEKTKIVRDTVQIVRTDTVRMVYTNTEYKESKDLEWWQSVLLCLLGGMAVGLIFYKNFMQNSERGGKRG